MDKFQFGSKLWPIDLTQDLAIFEEPEVYIVKVTPGAPKKKFRDVMPEEEMKWLKSLSSIQRKIVFSKE